VRISYRGSGKADPACVLKVITNAEWWASWLPGLRASEVVTQTNAVVAVLTFDGPRHMALSVDVKERADGVSIRMVEGDWLAVDGEVTVTEHADGAEVMWRLSLVFPFAIPGSLATELRQELLPSWNEALFRAARRESDQCAD